MVWEKYCAGCDHWLCRRFTKSQSDCDYGDCHWVRRNGECCSQSHSVRSILSGQTVVLNATHTILSSGCTNPRMQNDAHPYPVSRFPFGDDKASWRKQAPALLPATTICDIVRAIAETLTSALLECICMHLHQACPRSNRFGFLGTGTGRVRTADHAGSGGEYSTLTSRIPKSSDTQSEWEQNADTVLRV